MGSGGSDPAEAAQQPESSQAARSLEQRLAPTFVHVRGDLSQGQGRRPREATAPAGTEFYHFAWGDLVYENVRFSFTEPPLMCAGWLLCSKLG